MPHLLPRSFHSGPFLLTVVFACIFITTTGAALNDAENADSEAVASAAAEAAQTRFARASPLRWGKRGSEVLRWGKREPLRWGKRSTDNLVDQRPVRDAPLRYLEQVFTENRTYSTFQDEMTRLVSGLDVSSYKHPQGDKQNIGHGQVNK